MDFTEYFLIGVAVALVTYVVVIYNGLVQLRNDVRKAWSNIDVLLKQRHDEIPRLVETCKGYMDYERETFLQVMKARRRVARARQEQDVETLGPAEEELRAGLGSIFMLAEDYPELKADESFRHLQTRITELEDMIADRRELFNHTVTNLNVRTEQFPDTIVAGAFGFERESLLRFEADELRNVDVGRILED